MRTTAAVATAFLVALASLLPWATAALAAEADIVIKSPDVAAATIDRGLAFLAKDALAWKAEHNCASCHHASLVAWAMREAKLRGHAVDEPVLADMTKWLGE